MRDSGDPKLDAELLARSRRSACRTHKSKTLPAILCSSSVPGNTTIGLCLGTIGYLLK
jgi:hypothetical protein